MSVSSREFFITLFHTHLAEYQNFGDISFDLQSPQAQALSHRRGLGSPGALTYVLPGGVRAKHIGVSRTLWGQRVKPEYAGWTGHDCPTDLTG